MKKRVWSLVMVFVLLLTLTPVVSATEATLEVSFYDCNEIGEYTSSPWYLYTGEVPEGLTQVTFTDLTDSMGEGSMVAALTASYAMLDETATVPISTSWLWGESDYDDDMENERGELTVESPFDFENNKYYAYFIMDEDYETYCVMIQVPNEAVIEEEPYTATFTAFLNEEELDVKDSLEEGYGYKNYLNQTTRVTLYTVEIPVGTTEVNLEFSSPCLVYNYYATGTPLLADDNGYLAGAVSDYTSGASEATVKVDANNDSYNDYIQVQAPYHEDYSGGQVLFAILFVFEEEETQGTIPMSVVGTSATATMSNESIEALSTSVSETEDVVFSIPYGSEVNDVTISSDVFSSIAYALETRGNDSDTVTFETSTASVTFDRTAIADIASKATAGNIVLFLEESTFTTEETEKVGYLQVGSIIEINLTINGEDTHTFEGKATLSVPFTPDDGYLGSDYDMFYIDAEEPERLDTEYVSGSLVFDTTHFSTYAAAHGSVRRVTLSEAYEELSPEYVSLAVTNTESDDINAFWPMLAKSSIVGISPISVNFSSFSYGSMGVQKWAKTLIAMANNGYDVTTKVYNNKSIVTLLTESQQPDGSFKNGADSTVQANDQVWVIIALEIADASYNKDKAFDWLDSQQLGSGAFGYDGWADAGITSWVVNAYDLAGRTSSTYTTAKSWVSSEWSSLVSGKDSSSMAPWISTGNASSEQIQDYLDVCYDVDFKYFTWGNSTAKNQYSTYTGVQAVGDMTNGIIYELLDDYCAPDYSKSSSTSPESLEIEKKETKEAPATYDIEKFHPVVELPQESEVTEVRIAKWNSLTDIDRNSWWSGSAEYCVKHGYMEGYGQNKFGPNDPITRDQFVQLLYNISGADNTQYKPTFADVKDGSWNYWSIGWAEHYGIARGDGTDFGAGKALTRQDMVVLMARFFGIKAHEEHVYNDNDKIAPYASDAIKAFYEYGFATGTGDNNFAPLATSTRAQAAAVIERIMKAYYSKG